jgi:hypothetical protein
MGNPQVLTIANTANPVVVLNGVATGNYKFYLTVTDVNGCVATDSLEAFISGVFLSVPDRMNTSAKERRLRWPARVVVPMNGTMHLAITSPTALPRRLLSM